MSANVTAWIKIALFALGALLAVGAIKSAIDERDAERTRAASTARAYEAELMRASGLLAAEIVRAEDLEARLAELAAAPAVAAARSAAPSGAHVVGVVVGRAEIIELPPAPPDLPPSAPGEPAPCALRYGERLELGIEAALLRGPAGAYALTGDLFAYAGAEHREIARSPISAGELLLSDDMIPLAQPQAGGWLIGSAASWSPQGWSGGPAIGYELSLGGLRVYPFAGGVVGASPSVLGGVMIGGF
jgi:hypothetical protein